MIRDDVRWWDYRRGEVRDVGDDVVDERAGRLQVCRLGNQLNKVQLV